MNNMCVAGIWLSCVGLALGIFITISSIVTVFTDPSYRNMLDQMYQQMYGVDMEEFWQSYLSDMPMFSDAFCVYEIKTRSSRNNQ